MTKANVNVKIDRDVKELAIKLLDRMGLDQTTAIEMFYRQIIAERRLPFQPIVSSILDEQIIAAAIKNNPKMVELTADKNGNILIDKKLHPEVYDWAENG
ncbi:MAG: type II toxin-antitoxin system RelB/DinJ family antitoxin [Treponema sp.]|nr:type II toxin-antitoxin system RelB/DinJ family antitoxin [Treponema sp.]MCL2251935.1 type II toxin-antitoxin system RelB/DinJ family antitoxin [Treponema sp.]